MGMVEIWLWLGTVVEYLMIFCGVLAGIFFLLAVITGKRARFYGFLAGGFAIGMMVLLVLGSVGNSFYGAPLPTLMGTIQLALSVIFIGISLFLIYFAYDAKNNVQHKEAFYTTFIMAIIVFIIGIALLIPSLTTMLGPQDITTIEGLTPAYTLTFPHPIDRVILVIIPLTLFTVGAYVFKEMKTQKYASESSQEQDKLQKTFSKLDLEISRKIYHVIIIVMIIGYLFVGYVVFDAIYHFTFYNLPIRPEMLNLDDFFTFIINPRIIDFRAGHLLLLMAVGWIFIILLFTDFVRIKRYRFYPIKMLARVYRDKERFVLAPHVYLTTGFLFIIMLSDFIAYFLGTPTISAQIVMITIMVSALADAIATIIGITKGKHHLKGGTSKKTWEGWIAGFVSALILGLLSFIVLMPQYGGTLLQAVVLSLLAAIIFGLIDYFSPPIPISDNLLNPIAICLVLWGVSFLFFI